MLLRRRSLVAWVLNGAFGGGVTRRSLTDITHTAPCLRCPHPTHYPHPTHFAHTPHTATCVATAHATTHTHTENRVVASFGYRAFRRVTPSRTAGCYRWCRSATRFAGFGSLVPAVPDSGGSDLCYLPSLYLARCPRRITSTHCLPPVQPPAFTMRTLPASAAGINTAACVLQATQRCCARRNCPRRRRLTTDPFPNRVLPAPATLPA